MGQPTGSYLWTWSGDPLSDMWPWQPTMGHRGDRRAALLGLLWVEQLPLDDGGFPFLGTYHASYGA